MHGIVERITWVTPHLVAVELGGDGLDGFEPTPHTDQYVNVLFPPEGAPYAAPFDPEEAKASGHRPIGRRYTIRRWDPARRIVTLEFVVHGDVGTAGRWAASAAPGQILQFVGPSGGYAPDPAADWHLLVGDESALPAIAATVEALEAGQRAVVVALVDDADHRPPLRSSADLEIRWVHRCDDPGNHDLLPDAVRELTFPAGDPQVFVHGEAAEVRAIRRHLLGDRGLVREDVSISPYWRRDHTDEQWRAIKRDWLAEQAADVPVG